MSMSTGPYGRYPGTKRPSGHRLADPRDPAVRQALTRQCPECNAEPGKWCIGVSGTTMRGRILTRIHFARCTFNPDPPPPPKPTRPPRRRTTTKGE